MIYLSLLFLNIRIECYSLLTLPGRVDISIEMPVGRSFGIQSKSCSFPKYINRFYCRAIIDVYVTSPWNVVASLQS